METRLKPDLTQLVGWHTNGETGRVFEVLVSKYRMHVYSQYMYPRSRINYAAGSEVEGERRFSLSDREDLRLENR